MLNLEIQSRIRGGLLTFSPFSFLSKPPETSGKHSSEKVDANSPEIQYMVCVSSISEASIKRCGIRRDALGPCGMGSETPWETQPVSPSLFFSSCLSQLHKKYYFHLFSCPQDDFI